MQLKILIAPLDWGLGHATRCLPLIHYLQTQGHQITVAAPKHITSFVKETLPNIDTLFLFGYDIHYSKNPHFLLPKILWQIPKILKAIKREHQWLLAIQQQEHFDLIISDNRYGLYLPQTPCAIMTHQLSVQTGFGHGANTLLRQVHYRFLKKFKACWIVDEPQANNLSGHLAHPDKLPPHAYYIGNLSQMALFATTSVKSTKNIPLKILILLSGAEPMRSILERQLMQQCKALSGKYEIDFVAGNINTSTSKNEQEQGLRYYAYLSAQQLFPLMQQADLVICRSGYSTLMDLAFFGKKALLIPTPGQTEQEYLAKHLKQLGLISKKQQAINLTHDIPKALQASAFPKKDGYHAVAIDKALKALYPQKK